MTTKTIMAACQMSLLLFLGACNRPEPPVQGKKKTVDVVTILIDQSSSANNNRCSEAAGRVLTVLKQSKRADFLLLGTGSKKTGSKPVVLADWMRYWATTNPFKKKSALADARQQFARELEQRCQASTSQMDSSPIFNGLSWAVESIASRCSVIACGSRTLYVHTDGHEGVHSAIRSALLKGQERTKKQWRKRTSKKLTLPKLETDAIEVHICVGDHRADHMRADLDSLKQTWRAVLGSQTTFSLSCGEVGRE